MSSWSHGEKKGLIKSDDEKLKQVEMLKNKLEEIAGTAPQVKKFEIQRQSVLGVVLDQRNFEVVKQLDPTVASKITDTQNLKLTRAEKPLAYDVALLTRSVVKESGATTTMDFGADGENGESSDDNSFDGGEGDDD